MRPSALRHLAQTSGVFTVGRGSGCHSFGGRTVKRHASRTQQSPASTSGAAGHPSIAAAPTSRSTAYGNLRPQAQAAPRTVSAAVENPLVTRVAIVVATAAALQSHRSISTKAAVRSKRLLLDPTKYTGSSATAIRARNVIGPSSSRRSTEQRRQGRQLAGGSEQHRRGNREQGDRLSDVGERHSRHRHVSDRRPSPAHQQHVQTDDPQPRSPDVEGFVSRWRLTRHRRLPGGSPAAHLLPSASAGPPEASRSCPRPRP